MIRVGIFFGGPSREREISFAGGRTVYDNLDKSIFDPVPVFVDAEGNLAVLDWPNIYKGSIRDFFPPVSHLKGQDPYYQVYADSFPGRSADMLTAVGRPVTWRELQQEIDFAFLALHGVFGEDGQIQGILESLGIPYTGSRILPSAIGMDKSFQKRMMSSAGFAAKPHFSISRRAWDPADCSSWYRKAVQEIGFPLVVRPANSGSSIGVHILGEESGEAAFAEAVDAAFFRRTLKAAEWRSLDANSRKRLARDTADIRSDLGFPLKANGLTLYHPAEWLEFAEEYFRRNPEGEIRLEAYHGESHVLLEGFIAGREFSCIVIRNADGSPCALPPTGILKGKEVFDYRSKYLPGLSRKVTPIELPEADIRRIRRECERLYAFFSFNTYARIDGFFSDDGEIFLNDPNTTSGMMPSSFFFHQAAEIGLNPSQFLTYIVHASLQERIDHALYEPEQARRILFELEQYLESRRSRRTDKRQIAVILGGYSYERHISVESGRNIYEKLSSSDHFEPIPVFLSRESGSITFTQLPVNLLLKDNADDIREKIAHFHRHPLIEEIRNNCQGITDRFGSRHVVFSPQALSLEQLAEMADGAFIALHGRPGEDGTLQAMLESAGIPYNGSGPESASITIDKFRTLQILKEHGFVVAEQKLFARADYLSDPAGFIRAIEAFQAYPFVVKPVDDGCSSAVKVVRDRRVLEQYLSAIFREQESLSAREEEILGLKPREEFPRKQQVLVENLISRGDAIHFLEITGGLLTHHRNGDILYEVFEPSEALSTGEVLSLEEKFLTGEGQNITPARFATGAITYEQVAGQVKATLEKAARILGVKGYARIDAFVRIYADGRAETIIIEVNSLPGMTPATCIFHQTAINGYTPYDFIDRILQFGFEERTLSTQS